MKSNGFVFQNVPLCNPGRSGAARVFGVSTINQVVAKYVTWFLGGVCLSGKVLLH